MKRVFLFILLAGIAAISCRDAFGGQKYSYSELMRQGKSALEEGLLPQALEYFTAAHKAAPAQSDPGRYINLIQGITSEKVAVIELDDQQKIRLVPLKQQPLKTAPLDERPQPAVSSKTDNPPSSPSLAQQTMELNSPLWARQPNMPIVVEKGAFITLQGNQIDRSLSTTDGIVKIERIDRNRLKVTALSRGTTFLHVWDQTGRWTFHLEVIFPQTKLTKVRPETISGESQVDPFRLTYSSSWSSFYQGPDAANLERSSLTYVQWAGLYGPTPYGQIDGFARFTKFAESTEVTGYGGGWVDGQIGPFEKFTIRGGDISQKFSDLSLPGKYFRGGLLDAYAFQESIKYSLLWGQDRAVYDFITPGVVDRKNSYIEGAKVTLFPKSAHRYSANYARGYGQAREASLKEKVYSLDTRHQWGPLVVSAEQAYDETNLGRWVNTEYKSNTVALRVNARDIEPQFMTVTGIPSGQGEIGGNISLDWTPQFLQWDTNLDVFRDRRLFNPDRPETFNYDFSSSLTVPLNDSANIGTAVFYINTPGLISPHSSLRVNSRYAQTFRVVGKRQLTAFVGGSYEESRFEKTPDSEFDRYGVSTGFRLALIRNLYYFANYDYDWVNALATDEISHPRVLTTGVNYTKQLIRNLSGRAGVTYRNEDDAAGPFSFLAGEDSLNGNLGLTFQPNKDFQFYVDGSIRDVQSKNSGGSDFTEGDIRFGIQSSWDLPLRWSNSGIVRGTVYKDLNNNGRQDLAERGIPNVTLRVGKSTAVTNRHGEYLAPVNAQEVVVAVNMNTVPEGFIAAEVLSQKVKILHQKFQVVDFGLTSRSGIYGVVFYDRNGNGQLDAADEFIPRIKITLDKGEETYTDFEGSYFFENISPGLHTVSFDVNSLPMDYLPLVKMNNPVEVREGTTFTFHIPLKKR